MVLDPKKRIPKMIAQEVSLVGNPANKRKALFHKAAKVDASADPIVLTPEENEELRKRSAMRDPTLEHLICKSIRQLSHVHKGDEVAGASDAGWDATTQAIMAGVGRISSQLVGKVTLDDWIYLLEQVGFADAPEDSSQKEEADKVSEQLSTGINNGAVVVKGTAPDTQASEDDMAKEMEKPEGVDPKTHEQAKAAALALYNAKIKGDKDKAEKSEDEDAEEEEMDKGKKVGKSAKAELTDERFIEFTKAAKLKDEQIANLVRKSEAMERQLAEHTEFRVAKSIKEQVDKDLRHIGGDQEKLINIIKHARGVEDKSIEADLMQVLKACNEQLRGAMSGGSSSYQSMGSSAPGDVGDSPLAQIEALVDAAVQKSGNKNTRSQVYDQVIQSEQGAALFREYRKQQGRRG